MAGVGSFDADAAGRGFNKLLTLRRSPRCCHIAGMAWMPAPGGRESHGRGGCVTTARDAEWASPGIPTPRRRRSGNRDIGDRTDRALKLERP
jgi:hypothetical protein